MSTYQLRAKKMKLQLAVLLISTLLRGSIANDFDCITSFEKSFEDALATRNSCTDPDDEFTDDIYPPNCCQIAEASKLIFNIYDPYTPKSGVYIIREPCRLPPLYTQEIFHPIMARCNMESRDGGWTVLFRRTPIVAEQVSFSRPWADYEIGFGDPIGEFWYGLKNMNCLTTRQGPMEVEIELRKTDGTKKILSYGSFKVDGPDKKYAVHLSDKQYDGHDYFSSQNGMKFSTFDQDNDLYSGSCSKVYNDGGFWFSLCFDIYLTDMPKPRIYYRGFITYDYAELRVRQKDCRGLTA